MKNSNKKLLSIVVNCYNEQETIEIFYETVLKVLTDSKINYEFIYIDDCSKDDTLNIIKKLAKKDKNVHYISMSRNFGKEQGIYAGYENAKGDYIVCMDADLQDPPSLIPKMYNLLESGEYDAVCTTSTSRNEYSFLRKIFTKFYYFLLKRFSNFYMREGIRDYRMVNRSVANSILNMKEYNRYSRYLFEYAGFKTYWINFDNEERVAGTTKWSFKRLFMVAMDAFLSSTKLLNLSFVSFILNLILSIVSLVFLLLNVNNNCFSLLLIIFIVLMSLTIIMFMFTITNLFISRIYNQVLNRPIYIVKEKE